jgi:hypothetical protein
LPPHRSIEHAPLPARSWDVRWELPGQTFGQTSNPRRQTESDSDVRVSEKSRHARSRETTETRVTRIPRPFSLETRRSRHVAAGSSSTAALDAQAHASGTQQELDSWLETGKASTAPRQPLDSPSTTPRQRLDGASTAVVLFVLSAADSSTARAPKPNPVPRWPVTPAWTDPIRTPFIHSHTLDQITSSQENESLTLREHTAYRF